MESTTIYQLSSATPLVASTDDNSDNDLTHAKQQLKSIITKLSTDPNPVFTTIDVNNKFIIYYSPDKVSDLLITVIASHSSQPTIVNAYIDEIHNEYLHIHGSPIDKFVSPYSHMSFESFISKSKLLYSSANASNSTTAAGNEKLKQLDSQLHEVTNILHTNINDLLNRGQNINNLHDLSSALKDQSSKYKKYATKINWDLWVKQNAPLAVVALVILLVLYRYFG